MAPLRLTFVLHVLHGLLLLVAMLLHIFRSFQLHSAPTNLHNSPSSSRDSDIGYQLTNSLVMVSI